MFNGLKIKLRRVKYYKYFKSWDIKIGKNFIMKGGRGKNKIGKNFCIADNCVFEAFEPTGVFTVGDYCYLAYGVICSVKQKISIGNHVWIGEYTSLRDTTHTHSIHATLGSLPDKGSTIIIGNNVWIGRGCMILEGTEIRDNVIVGANSVVKGKLEANSLYAGTPAKLIKKLVDWIY